MYLGNQLQSFQLHQKLAWVALDTITRITHPELTYLSSAVKYHKCSQSVHWRISLQYPELSADSPWQDVLRIVEVWEQDMALTISLHLPELGTMKRVGSKS